MVVEIVGWGMRFADTTWVLERFRLYDPSLHAQKQFVQTLKLPWPIRHPENLLNPLQTRVAKPIMHWQDYE